jgi:TRAP-type C4-dicarboxylate transport system substrate-binding protein
MTKVSRRAVLAGLASSAIIPAVWRPAFAAPLQINLSDLYPDTNYMVTAGKQFAAAVKDATSGDVVITVRSGGSLGFKGPELLRAVRDGLVPMADMPGVQQNGEDSIFDVEGLPFLVNSQDELLLLHKYLRPAMDKVAAKYNQKFLFMVPTPAQYLYTNVKVDNLAALAGLKTRGGDKSTVDVVTALGMSGIFLPWGELLPALASKRIDAVVTSATSAVDGRFWEFLKYVYLVNGTGLSQIVSIGMGTWNVISPENQKQIAEIADKLQPEFWAMAKGEGDKSLKTLEDNGMELVAYPKAMREEMLSRTRPLLDEKLKTMPAINQEVVADYLKAVGR